MFSFVFFSLFTAGAQAPGRGVGRPCCSGIENELLDLMVCRGRKAMNK